MRIKLRPNAKINLGLHVLGKRPDGFHDLDTIFIPLLDLCDTLVLDVGDGAPAFDLQVGGCYDAGPSGSNLVARAYEALLPYGPPPVRAQLSKCIPVGSGLGGGSADATFFLRAVAPLCAHPPTPEELRTLALSLGSDCPFFLYNTPCHATGRGEQLVPIDLPLAGLWLTLCTPPITVSTGWAFQQVHPCAQRVPLLEAVRAPMQQWERGVENDFQSPIATRFPEVAMLLTLFCGQRALYTALSGSGPSVYALFAQPQPVDAEAWPGHFFHSQPLRW